MKNFLRKYWPFLCFFLLVAVAGIYGIGQEATNIVIESTATQFLKEGVRLEQVSLLKGASSDDVSWSVKAEQVLLKDNNRVVVFKEFYLKVKQQNGQPFTLTGQEGRYLRAQKKLFLKGDLLGQSSQGYTVSTNSAIFNEREGWVKGEEMVKVMGPFFHITGLGFFVDMKRRLVKIGPQVTAIIKGIKDEGILQ